MVFDTTAKRLSLISIMSIEIVIIINSAINPENKGP
jgi:hypothetical protein